jgi:ankyrin repeat protein
MKIKAILFVFFLVFQMQAQEDVFQIARNGSLSDIESAYKKNPKIINEISSEGYSALILACYNNNIDVVGFLIKKGADVNGNSKMGTPLMAAAVKNNKDCVSMLLKNKADVNMSDANGSTALHYAVIFKHYDLIALLLEFSADKLQKDGRGLSPIDYAQMSKDDKLINLLN